MKYVLSDPDWSEQRKWMKMNENKWEWMGEREQINALLCKIEDGSWWVEWKTGT